MTRIGASTFRINRYACISLFLLSLFVVLLRSTGSLWLDELITAWVVNGSLHEVISRSIHFQGQSPIYFLVVWFASNLFGDSEWVLRAPGIAAAVLSVWIFYRFVRLLIGHEETALMAAALLSVHPVFLENATNARPYSIALACFLCSLFFFLRYLKEGRERDIVFWAVSSLLLFYTHYVLVLGVLVQPALMAVIQPGRLHYKKLFFYSSFAAVLSLPGFWHLKQIASKADIYKMAGSSDWMGMLSSSRFFLLFILLFFAAGCLWLLNRKAITLPGKTASLLFALHWPFLAILLIYGLHHLLGITLLQDRYRFWMIPGEALLCSIVVGAMVDKRFQAIALLFSIIYCIPGIQGETPKDDWRSAVNYVETHHPKIDLVWIYSGLIETQDVGWLENPVKQDYLKSPWTYYQTRPSIEVKILPLDTRSESHAHYFETVVEPTIKNSEKTIMIVRDILLGDRLSSDLMARMIPDYPREKKTFGHISIIEWTLPPVTDHDTEQGETKSQTTNPH